jgi:hypothetical protein
MTKLLAMVAFAAHIRVDDEMSDVAVKVEVPILLAMVAFAAQIRVDDEMSDVAVTVEVARLLVIVAFAPHIRVDDEMSDVAVTVEVARLLVIVAFGTLRSRLIDASVVTTRFEINAVPLTSNKLEGVVRLIPTCPLASMVIRSSPAVTTPSLFVAGR